MLPGHRVNNNDSGRKSAGRRNPKTAGSFDHREHWSLRSTAIPMRETFAVMTRLFLLPMAILP